MTDGTSNDRENSSVSTSTKQGGGGGGCPYALNYDTSSTSSTPASSSPVLSSSSDASNNSNLTPMQALQLAKTSCPAFKSACPFRHVHDANGMREALKSLPKSHGNVNGNGNVNQNVDVNTNTDSDSGSISESLKVALAHVHTVSQTLAPEETKGEAKVKVKGEAKEEKEEAVETSNKNVSGAANVTVNVTHHEKGRRRSSSFSIKGGCPFKTQYKSGTSFVEAMENLSLFGFMAKVIEATDTNTNTNTNLETKTASTSTTTSSTMKQRRSEIMIIPASASASASETEIKPDRRASLPSQSSMRRVRSHTSLSNALKEGTAQSHSAAESVHFVKEFIKGNIDRDLYSRLMLNLYYVYRTLENAIDEYGPTHFNTLYFPKELKRTETLRDDVDFYLGVDMEDELQHTNSHTHSHTHTYQYDEKYEASVATLDYMRRVEYIANTEPLLLLSHAYTRYLGDLSGGKVLARVARRALHLQDKDNSGLAFYNFEHIPSAKVFKDEYRKALDELDLTDGEIERLVAEANVAFVLNMRIFEELDVLSGIEGSSVRDYKDAVKYYDDCIQAQKKNVRQSFVVADNKENKCPFANMGSAVTSSGGNSDANTNANANAAPAECPFAMLGGASASTGANANTNTNTADTHNKSQMSTSSDRSHEGGRCPWPFVFFHDPRQGMRDWQTWAVTGLVLCFVWSKIETSL